MADRDLVRPESELKITTEALQSTIAASMYQCNKWQMPGWDLNSQENLHPDRRCPYFRKKVTKGCLHHLPQSVICIPTHFMQVHPDTFQRGNLITLEGPSGNTWKVRATGKPILHSGWRAFAHDHDLQEGDELCFTLTQSLHFIVDVLNCNGVVKESALTATNTGKYTVASICYPYEYVHRPRKRNGQKTANSPKYHENFGYGALPPATIASRCKTTARDRSAGYPMGARLKFSTKRKQWECRQEKDGREVVTILDSDDDETAEPENSNQLLSDHPVELSFGSVQVQNHRNMSKTQKLVANMKEQGELVPQWSNPTAQEIAGHGEESKVAEDNVDPARVMTVPHPETATELINIIFEKPNYQAQVSRDVEDTMMSNNEETETHLINTRLVQSDDHVQLQITPESILCADSTEVLKSGDTIPTSPAEHKPVQVGPLTEKAKLLFATTESHEVVTSIAVPGGDVLFETLQNIVDIPVIADTNSYQCRQQLITPGESMQTPIRPGELAVTNHEHCDELKILSHSGSKTSTTACVLKSKNMQVIADTNSYQWRQQLITPGESMQSPIGTPIRPENLAVTSHAALHCDKLAVTKILSNKTFTTACVLKSKRMQVAKLHRAKTLRAAQALTKKLRSPNFVAVMKSCNVYTDFTMDIPAEFGKRSRLPATEAKVTLVCDEVPTMCKAIWIGTNPEKPKLDAQAWMEFSRSHFLEEGDVCVFEIFNRVTIRIGIHIFRVVGLSRSLLPDHWTQHYNVVHLDAHQAEPSCAAATLPLGSIEKP